MPQGVSIAVLAIEEDEVRSIQEHTVQEAIQSSIVAVRQTFPPRRGVPRSNLAPQPSSDGKREPSQERVHTLTRAHSSSPKSMRLTHVAPKILPIKYEFCDVEDLVMLIADMISELIQINDQLPLKDSYLTRFHSRSAPKISVVDYLQRLTTHVALTLSLLLCMVYFIDRLCTLYPAFTITSLTIHRFLVAAATVGAKGLSDFYYSNATYARVGGIKVAELCLLELEFLYRVDWKIVSHPEVLVDYYRGLVERADRYVLGDDVLTTAKDDVIDSTV
jgi:Cyclin